MALSITITDSIACINIDLGTGEDLMSFPKGIMTIWHESSDGKVYLQTSRTSYGINYTDVVSPVVTSNENLATILRNYQKNNLTQDFYSAVVQGLVPKHSIIHKFGAALLTTTIGPITNNGTYKTPTVATALEFVSSDAQDGVGGTGARVITIIGINAVGAEISQDLITNGITAVQLTTNLLRLTRWYVKESGSYASSSTGSHVGILTIRESGGGATWTVMSNSPFPSGQSQIGAYTVPIGYTAYLLSKDVFIDSTKSADIYFFKRLNILQVVAPFTPMLLVEREIGITGGYPMKPVTPKLLGAGPMDVGFMGKISVGTAEASVEFELLIIED